MGNKCSSQIDTINPIIIDSQPATCYITIEGGHYLIYFPTLKEAYNFGQSFIDSPLLTMYPRIGSLVTEKTTYIEVCELLKNDNSQLIKIDEDAFMKIYVYLTNKTHKSIKHYDPSVENPYSLLYKLNKL